LTNTTLEFVSTIGNLYYQRGDHKNIADKKIQFFFDYLHAHYYVTTTQRNENFVSLLARKSGVGEQTVRSLINTINQILLKEKISKEELTSLNTLLEKFYKKK
jgi:predicted nucleic acid-binding protein